MAGDVENVDLWQEADVYVGPIGATEPTDVTSEWDEDWDLVGLLDGDEGFTQAREEDTSERYAWGKLLVKKTRSKHKRTIRFVALEDNATVFSLVNPGSTREEDGGLTTSTVSVPTYSEFAIGFETREGDKVKRRLVKRADIEEIGELKDSEADVAVYEITVVLIPETDGVLYVDLEGDDPAGS